MVGKAVLLGIWRIPTYLTPTNRAGRCYKLPNVLNRRHSRVRTATVTRRSWRRRSRAHAYVGASVALLAHMASAFMSACGRRGCVWGLNLVNRTSVGLHLAGRSDGPLSSDRFARVPPKMNILHCLDLALKPLARLSLPHRYGLPRNHNLWQGSPAQECGCPQGT